MNITEDTTDITLLNVLSFPNVAMSFLAGLTCVELCHFSVAKAVDLWIRSKNQ